MSSLKHTFKLRILLKAQLALVMVLSLAFAQEAAQCANPNATQYDGFLDTHIAYAQFSGALNSSLRMRNPLSGYTNVTEYSMMLWLRALSVTEDGSSQSQRILDCGDMLSVRLEGTSLKVNVSTNATLTNGSVTNQISRQAFDIKDLAPNQLSWLDWQHLAVSLKDGSLRAFLNGWQIFSVNLTSKFTIVNQTTCSLGNSLFSTEPFSGHIRHLAFLSIGLTGQSIASMARMHLQPGRSDVLAYFKFDGTLYETHIFNTSRNVTVNNVSIGYSPEPETTCFCTYQGPAALILDHSQSLPVLKIDQPLPQDGPQQSWIDDKGFTAMIWAQFRIQNRNDSAYNRSVNQEFELFRMENYLRMWVENMTTLRVEISSFDSMGTVKQTQRISIPSAVFFDSWVLYECSLSKNRFVLTVNQQTVLNQTISMSAFYPANSINLTIGNSGQAPVVNSLKLLVYIFSLFKNIGDDSFERVQSVLGLRNHLYPLNQSALDNSRYGEIAKYQFTTDYVKSVYDDSTGDTTHQFQSVDGSAFWQTDQKFAFTQFSKTYCPSETPSLFDGISCKSAKVAPEFFASNQFQTDRYLTLTASMTFPSSFTTDLWFKRLLSADAFAENILYASYDSMGNVQFKLSYVASSISCTYNETTGTLPYTIALDSWYHAACVVTPTSIQIILFEQKTGLSQINFTDIVTTQSNIRSEVRTIGNLKTGLFSANALIREVRIINYSVSMDEMEGMRRLKNPTFQLWQSSLSLSEGYQSQYFTDSSERAILATTKEGLTWVKNDDLTVCPFNTVYDGQCCASQNLSNLSANLTFEENTTSSVVTISAKLIGAPLNLMGFVNYTWSLFRVNAQNIDASIDGSRQKLIALMQQQQGRDSIMLPSSQFFLNSSYSFSVLISTPLYSRPVAQGFLSVSLACPRVSIVPSLNPLIHQLNFETKLLIQISPELKCFGKSAITVKNVVWTHNNTGGTPYTIAKNKQSITLNKEAVVKADTDIRIDTSVTLSNGQTFNDTRTVRFLKQSVIIIVRGADSNGYLLFVEGDDLFIDANSSLLLANTILPSELAYSISCPSIVKSGNCLFNQSTGVMSIPWSQLNNTVPNIDYTFQLTYGKPQSAQATSNITLKVRWMTKVNEDMQKCPGLYLSQQKNLTVFRPDMKSNWVYGPAFVQDCFMNGQVIRSFRKSKVTYSIDAQRLQALQGTTFVNGNQTFYPLVPNLTSNNFADTFALLNEDYQFAFLNDSVISRIKPGNVIPLIANAEFQDRISNQTFADSLSFEVTISQSNLVLQTQSTDPVNGGVKRFNFEEDFFVNLSSSFDPDYGTYSNGKVLQNSSVLEYQYLCNGSVCQVDGSQMKGGILNITSWDRFRLNYTPEMQIPFSVTVRNPLVPWKPSKVYQFSAIAAVPTNGSVSCPRTNFNITFQNGKNLEKATELTFDITNASDFEIKIQADNCEQQNLAYQFIQFQVDIPLQGIQNSTSYIYKTLNGANTLQFMKTKLLSLLNPANKVTLTSTMMFNYTANGLKRFGYSTTKLTISRAFSLLMPILKANYTQVLSDLSQASLSAYDVGQEEYVFVDVSRSFDPDGLVNQDAMGFTFTCSSLMPADWCQSKVNSTSFGIDRQQRVEWGLNIIGTSFWIALQIDSPLRQSQVANVTFTVTAQKYDRCVHVQDQYQRLILPVNQVHPITLKPQFTFYCDPQNILRDGFSFNLNSDKFAMSSQSVPMSQSTDFQVTIVPLTTTLNDEKIDVSSTLTSPGISVGLYNILQYSVTTSPLQLPVIIQDTPTINFYTLEPFFISEQNGQNCKFTCRFGDLQVEDCGNIASGECKSNVMLSAYLYKAQILNADTVSSIQVSSPNVKTARVALNFVDVEPLSTDLLECSIKSRWPTIMSDRVNAFNASCNGTSTKDLKFTWYLHTLDSKLQTPQIIAKVGERSTLKLDPEYFKERIGVFYQLRVNIVKRADAQISRKLSLALDTPDPSNIKIGDATLNIIYDNDIILGNLSLVGYQDVNYGQLYFTVYYVPQGSSSRVYLVSKSTATQFIFLYPSSITSLTLEIRDLSDAVLTQTIDAAQERSDPLTAEQISQVDEYYSLTQFDGNAQKLSGSQLDAQSYALSVIIADTKDSIMLESFCAHAIRQFDSFTKSEKLVRTYFLPLSLLRILQNLNGCLQTSSQGVQVIDILMNDFKPDDILPTESDVVYDLPEGQTRSLILRQYDKLLSILIQFSDLDTTHLDFIQLLITNSQEAQFNSVDMGESVTINGVAKSKVTLSEWPVGDTLRVQRQDVSLAFDPLILGSLFITEATVKVSAPARVDFKEEDYPNITLYGDVIEIKILDQDQAQMITDSVDLAATLTFDKVNLNNANVKCGYYNEVQAKWLFNSEARIQTVVDPNNSRVQCLTSHFSIFSIFNETVLSKDTPQESKYEDNHSDKAVLVVSLTQLGVLIVAVILFVLHYCAQIKNPENAVTEAFATQLRQELNFKRLLKVISPVYSLWNTKNPIHSTLRALVLLNYLLFISLFVLIHLAINTYDKSPGEIVWLIVSLALIFMLCSGIARYQLVTRHIQDVSITNFIDKLSKPTQVENDYMSKAAKPVPTAADEVGHIPPITATNSKNKQYLEVVQLENEKEQSFLKIVPTEFLQVPKIVVPTHFKGDEESKESDESVRGKDMLVETGSDKEDAVMHSIMDYRLRIESAGKSKFEDNHVDDEAFHHIFAVQSHDGLRESDQAYEQDSSIDQSKHIGHTEKNMDYLNSRNNGTSHQASRLFNNNINGQEEYPEDIYQEFEGGSQEQGPELTTGITNRRDMYRTQDFQTENHTLKGSGREAQQESVYMVKVNNLSLGVTQVALLTVGLILNIILFVLVDISTQTAPYLASFFISTALMLFVVDPLLALAAHLTLRHVLGGSKNVFVHGIIGYKWLQLID